jgi:hypothetical protein
VQDGTLTLTPPQPLALGPHSYAVTAIDDVGNHRTLVEHVTIADTVPPVISVHSPGASGTNDPVLDVEAADDKSGIDPDSWTILVDGQQLVATPFDDRVLTQIGYLVNQRHTITITVRDLAGNTTTKTLTYLAHSTPGAAPFPGIDGIYPEPIGAWVHVGEIVRLRAAVASHGRPLDGFRAEVRQGGRVVASKVISPDGTVDIQTPLYYRKPLVLVVDGSGLHSRTIRLRWHRL